MCTNLSTCSYRLIDENMLMPRSTPLFSFSTNLIFVLYSQCFHKQFSNIITILVWSECHCPIPEHLFEAVELLVFFYKSYTTQNGSYLAQQFPSIAPSFVRTSSNSWSSWSEGLVEHLLPIFLRKSFTCRWQRLPVSYLLCCTLFMYSFQMFQPCKSLRFYIPYKYYSITKAKQKVPKRTNSLLSFDTTRTAHKTKKIFGRHRLTHTHI
jgi:hypothetical protein